MIIAIMMPIDLFSIEQELGQIAEMEMQIISFLRIEKEAECVAGCLQSGCGNSLSDLFNRKKYEFDEC